ncbi:beta-hexosaminidase [Burkholderia gladioli]|uniref:beta-hexosaminidase n=1 Tax=Burkholderia gladioli TaxID=28095 RepID=UPI0016412B46|nr:beta-hexosaminidase [Burkholderia gladioli]
MTMSRTKLKATPAVTTDRRDTLSLRTVVRYDRNAKRPSTPILVGKYVVGRRPITDSLHTLYLILDEGDIAGTQISIPSEDDCAQAVKRLRDKKRAAAKTASMEIRKAKKRGNGQRQTDTETA